MKFEIFKEWLESVPLEDDTSDCSAGILKYDLASYVEDNPTEHTPPPKRRTMARRRKSATTTTAPATLNTPSQ